MNRKIRVRLAFPPSDKRYANRFLAYPEKPMPPQSGHGLLAYWARKHAKKDFELKTISDQKPLEAGNYSNRTLKEIADFCKDGNLVGITCWYHNQENALTLARMVKKENPEARIVLGGPNVSNGVSADLILRNHPEVDYIVRRDGEEPLRMLIDSEPLQNIPGLVYRSAGAIMRNRIEDTNLRRIPLWDFKDCKDHEKLLLPHSSLPEEELPMVGIFSNRGCIKALKKGPCSYCTSSFRGFKRLPPELFWKQMKHLYSIHNLSSFYCVDNIFTLSFQYVKSILDAKPLGLPDFSIRVYSYPTDISSGGLGMAENLAGLNVSNVFFGIESFDPKVNKLANKEPFSLTKISESISLLKDHGIGVTIALIVGLPGESKAGLEKTTRFLSNLLKKYSKGNGKGGVERLYISLGMPLIGTSWYLDLVSNHRIRKTYFDKTGKDLSNDISPDYDLLNELSIVEYSSLETPEQAYKAISKIVKMAKNYLPEKMIGGFGLEKVPSP
ncbi:radical SAM protein [Candidatus Micrarchaeota archaeon]|nr:radical SAM protein [Candidatus Micrarchaeota archaeon]